MLAESWRNALEGKSDKCLDIAWLRMINQRIRERMNLPEGIHVQKACWNNTARFERYKALAKRLISVLNPESFMIPIDKDIQTAAKEISKQGREILEHYYTPEDHTLISTNELIEITA